MHIHGFIKKTNLFICFLYLIIYNYSPANFTSCTKTYMNMVNNSISHFESFPCSEVWQYNQLHKKKMEAAWWFQ